MKLRNQLIIIPKLLLFSFFFSLIFAVVLYSDKIAYNRTHTISVYLTACGLLPLCLFIYLYVSVIRSSRHRTDRFVYLPYFEYEVSVSPVAVVEKLEEYLNIQLAHPSPNEWLFQVRPKTPFFGAYDPKSTRACIIKICALNESTILLRAEYADTNAFMVDFDQVPLYTAKNIIKFIVNE